MLASVSFFIGMVVGAVIVAVYRRSEQGALGWWTLGLGLSAGMALALSTWLVRANDTQLGVGLLSIAFGFASVVTGGESLRRGSRRWTTWVGLIAGLIPALFWIAFLIGHLVGGEG